jgi:hypothetical protein
LRHHLPVSSDKILQDTSIQHQYYPKEIDWIVGTNSPPSFDKHQCTNNGKGEFYLTGLGNQCGCDASGFHPSHSSWIYNSEKESDDTENSNDIQTTIMPSDEQSVLRLVQRLIKSNSTLCFAGDSIDLQLYQSIERQLQRLEGLEQLYYNKSLDVSFETREVPVNYSTPCGALHAGFHPCGFKRMTSLKETLVRSKSSKLGGGIGLIRYIKFYGWSPWVSSVVV